MVLSTLGSDQAGVAGVNACIRRTGVRACLKSDGSEYVIVTKRVDLRHSFSKL